MLTDRKLIFMNETFELSKFGNVVQVIYAGDSIKHDIAIEVLNMD